MHRFRSLDVWRVAEQLAREAYSATSQPAFRGHYALSDQIRRAATSIPANLAEGYGLGTTPQLVRCTRTALGSTYELTVHLELALAVGILDQSTFNELEALTHRTTSLLIGLLRGLRARYPQ